MNKMQVDIWVVLGVIFISFLVRLKSYIVNEFIEFEISPSRLIELNI